MVKARSRWTLFGVAAAVLLVGAESATADNPVSAKRAEAVRVLVELRGLDDRLEQSVEAYNLARIRLGENARALKTEERELVVARRNLARAQRRLADRLVYIYTSSSDQGPVEILFGARSLSNLIDRVEAVQQVTRQDSLVLREVGIFKAQALRRRQALRQEHERRVTLVAELASHRVAIKVQLGARQRLLASIQGEIARLQAQEQARQRKLRSQAQARLAAARAAAPVPAMPEPVVGASAVAPDGIAVAPDTRHAHVVAIAMRYLGVPYRWAGASPESGFDCSGLVMYVYAQVGVSLPHNAALQYGYGMPVAQEDLEPGDIVFFDGLGHDGIYIGGGQFIQAPRTGDVVKISSLSEPWYASAYVGARRLP